MQQDGLGKQILKSITNLFITVPEFKFLGTIVIGLVLLGIAFLIVKLLV